MAIVGPSARPVRLEALSRKKLAIDASIWIYQFLKAVRDKDGNSLSQSHIVGFFRRICKLLYFGILPIFVFDGGVPALKRQTINERRQRREKQSMSTRETAQKLLAIQLQREAENVVNDAKKNRNKRMIKIGDNDEYEETDEEIVFFEDLPINREQSPAASPAKKTSIKFRKDDEYHLPNLNEFKVSRGDARIMQEHENEYYEDFDHVDGININEIDPKSKEFEELPIATQYMILSNLRLKSRLRMGYRKDQLEELFPNSMDFSKFQIQQVQRRNFYTQKLMTVTGMDADSTVSKRVAGDSSRRYALIKNEDGWTLSLGTGNDSNFIQPEENRGNNDDNKQVDITREVGSYEKDVGKVHESDDSDSDFEEVPLEDKPETDEEKHYQQALIESIYDQYRTAPQASNTNNTLDEFDEEELKQAVEQSKLDYYNLKQQEQKLEENGEFDFGASVLFAANTNNNEPKTKPKDEEDTTKVTIIESPHPAASEPQQTVTEPSNLGRSFLFKSDSHQTGKIEIKKSNEIFEPVDSDEELSDVILYEKGKEDNREQQQQQQQEEKKSESELKVEHSTQQALPEWFQNDVRRTLNPHNEKFISTSVYVDRKRDNKEDEEAGLISWMEAREYLDQEHEKEVEKQQQHELPLPLTVEGSMSLGGKLKSVQDLESQLESDEVNNQNQRKAAVIDYQFEEQDEDELVRQLQQEIKDHESLRQRIKTSHTTPISSIETRITDEQLLKEKLQKAKRDSDEVTETMINDVQELLRRFGIPYITAPMEAEAQCAELYRIGLVDGIVTDDSDCFLFGGDKIYKNMFDQKQYVECYFKDDISTKIGLTREKLIELALLLGSDYTEGIKGIGPVLAMEILAEFDNLKNFKKWFDLHTKSQSDKSDTTTLQKNLLSRIKKGNLYLSDSFPDSIVEQAYLNPEVDSDPTEFKWGVPDLDQIRSFLMYNVSWSQSKVDEVMVPLIRDINRRKAEGTQSTIGEFFPLEYIQTRKELKMGKRLKTAANKLKKK